MDGPKKIESKDEYPVQRLIFNYRVCLISHLLTHFTPRGVDLHFGCVELDDAEVQQRHGSQVNG